jgi:hypothetical protein
VDFGLDFWTGVILGAAVAYLVATRFRYQHRLTFTLTETGRAASDRASYELVVRNVGFADLWVPDADKAVKNAVPMPRIDFGGARIVDWDNSNPSPRFYVPLAFAAMDHKVHVNIHRIGRRQSAVFSIKVRFTNPEQPLDRKNIYFFPGAIQDVKVRTRGLLRPPPESLKS